MKRYCISTSLLLVLAIGAFAQKHDYVWVMGRDRNQFIPGGDANVLDFNFDPVDIYYVSNNMNHFRLNASICDAAGNLLFYTNGVFIAGFNHEQIENGGGLNPGQYTSEFANDGLPIEQGAMFLPYPGRDSLFILLHAYREWSGLVSPSSYNLRLYHSIIDQRLNNHIGRVVEKNIPLIVDTIEAGKITAVRHANGRDWWSLMQKYDTNLYYRILIDDKGIALQTPQEVDSNVYSGAGQAVFSPDGSTYVHYTPRSRDLGYFVYIYDFDRCSGMLSNQRIVNLLADEIS